MDSARTQTTDAIRVLVVSATEAAARSVADGVATDDGLVVETVVANGDCDGDGDGKFAVVDGPVDCVLIDHTRLDSPLETLQHQVRDHHPDAIYVPVVPFSEWDRVTDRFTDSAVLALPKPPSGQLSILADCVRTAVSHRRSTDRERTRHSLQRFLWQLTDDLMEAPTQEAIVDCVCTRLAESAHFSAAWVYDRQPDPEVEALAGYHRDRVAQLRNALEATADEPPWRRAVSDRSGTLSSTTDPAASDGTPLTIASVPFLHRGIVYGVLNVADHPTGGGVDLSAAIGPLTSFSRTVGHALATAEMQAQSETVQQAIEQADPAIAILDQDGVVEYVNAAFESVYGYPKSEAIGSSPSLLLPDHFDADALLDTVRESTRWRNEIVKHSKDGRRFHADLSIAAVPVEGGTRRKYVAVASDITALKERQQRLQVLNRVLRHNLRNDMTVIRGGAEVIASDGTQDPQRVAENIIETANDLVSIGENVRRAASALDESTAQRPITLADVVADVSDRLRAEYPAGTVQVDVPGDVVLESNWQQLELVFSNLIENGLQHGGTAPTVSVSLVGDDAHEDTVCVAVSDDGPGIPDHEIETLRSGQETALKHGSGLGLWLVDSAVVTLGGELSFESDASGTTVYVELPGLVD